MAAIRILSAQGDVLASAAADESCWLLYRGSYAPGDKIVFESDDCHALVQVDASIPPALLYVPGKCFSYAIPEEGEPRAPYAPSAFAGDAHLLSLQACRDTGRRNLALNPLDQLEDSGAYPHIRANAETRGESVFRARNVLDGGRANTSHGEWPFQTWGVNNDEDATLTLSFGREVLADEVVLVLRADFPHDAYWTSVTLTLSDGTVQVLQPQKTAQPQHFPIGRHSVTSLTLSQLVKSDDPSPFPALRQLEVYGTEA